ncbi:hypothetical protein ACU4GD_11155 [Cupriavidus basilensis]
MISPIALRLPFDCPHMSDGIGEMVVKIGFTSLVHGPHAYRH